MESFKTANMKESAISIPDGNSTGNYEFGLDDSQTQTYTLPESAGTVDYHINTYSCSGISLGGEYEKYDCTVTVMILRMQLQQRDMYGMPIQMT